MSWLTLSAYKTWAGIVTTDATRDASLTVILGEIEDAVVRHLGRPVESAAYTRVLDGPPRRELLLPYWPVSPTGLRVWLNESARGDPSLFTDDAHELTRYDDFDLVVDQSDGTSKSGILLRLNGVWSAAYVRPVGRLAPELRPCHGCVKVTWTGGYASVPASLAGAGYLAASKLYASRKLGAQIQSGSDNGASFSLPGAATADGILGDPNIADALRPFKSVYVGAG